MEDTHLLKTPDNHFPPSDSPISQQTLDVSSPIRPLTPPLQTLDGFSPSPRIETLNESFPSSHLENLNGSSPSSHLETTLYDDQQLLPLSTVDGSLPFHTETLDDNSNLDFLADAETQEAEVDPEPSSPFRLFSSNLSNTSYSHWGSSWASWPNYTDSKPSVSQYVFGEFKAAMVGAGLENLGNTCFLNAVLQCFTHTVPLIQGLRSCSHMTPCVRGSEDFCVLCSLRDHIEFSLASSGGIVSPSKLVENLSYISSCFRRYQQEDAHEFLQCLLDRLDSCLDTNTHSKSLSSQDNNFVKQVFGGRLISKLRCCNCGHCSDTYEPLIDLSLEIEDADTLPSALESFTKVEKIEDPEVKFTCENCKEAVSVEKQFMLDQAPSVAAFHLKRFKNDGSYVEKIDKYVEYPLELDLQPFTSGSQDCNELKYELYAVVVHIGFSSTSGHYFCFIRSSPDTWYKLDDSKVTRVEEDFVLSKEAYILFYARQGTPWFSSLMETQKPCLDPSILNTSPKSVLDNMDNICTSYPSVGDVYSCGAKETRCAAEEMSVQFCSGPRNDGDEVNEPMIEVNEAGDDTHRIITPMLLGASDCCDESSYVEKTCTVSALREDTCNETFKIRNNANIHPQTPPRSPSPDIYSKESPEGCYNIPCDHLRSENQVACKRPFDSAIADSKKKEAARYAMKIMPTSRSLQIIKAMKGSPNKKRSKRKMSLSPCKKASPPSTRPKHSHRTMMRPVAAAILH